MSKLLKEDKFFDVSDYGRPIALFFAQRLKNTTVTPIHATFVFGVCGLIAVYLILNNYYFLAAIFLILKSIIDAIDGELARIKQTPSYTGRYLDSIFDILLNFLFLLAIGHQSHTSIWLTLAAFIGIQLQGTLYNYYYVIIRNNAEGADTTSKIIENKPPIAFPNESQKMATFLFHTYNFLYLIFDKTIYYLDQKAAHLKTFPNWFMTLVSCFGLGTQLFIMSILLVFNRIGYIIPFFIYYTLFIFVLIAIRRFVVNTK